MKTKAKRIWELDFLRGIAVLAMIVVNATILFDIFDISTTNTNTLAWKISVIVIASIFIFLSGISSTLSSKNQIKRGANIIVYGLAVTAISLVVAPTMAVYFGILHFIGLGIILSSPLLKFKKLNIGLSALFIAIGVLISSIKINTPFLLWLGLTYPGFQTLDYFPLLPWLGVMILGIAFSNYFIKSFKKTSPPESARLFCIIGRNSLLLYFLHVIVVLGIIYIIP